jgi:hypothetical protein
MHLEGKKTRLPAGAVGTYSWGFGTGMREAPEDNWGTSIPVESAPFDPDRVAFLLIRELYVWFGHSEDEIPYTKGNGDARVVDANQIAGIR